MNVFTSIQLKEFIKGVLKLFTVKAADRCVCRHFLFICLVSSDVARCQLSQNARQLAQKISLPLKLIESSSTFSHPGLFYILVMRPIQKVKCAVNLYVL